MRHYFWFLIPAFLSVIAIAAEPPQAAPAQNGENHPTWAYPVTDPTQPEGADVAGPRKLPDSTKSYTQKEIDDLGNPPDWYPTEHGDVPKIVSSGAANKGFACASCHLYSGHGHPESADLTGLSAGYLEQQMADFKSGDRVDPARMNTIAMATSDDDAKAAAEWFASLKAGVWVKVTEAAMVPKTFVNGGRMRLPLPAGGMEPIGNRIIEVPQDAAKATARDPRTGFIAYVPPGSLAKGEAIATTGGGKTISCNVCHGDGLKGFGDIPKLAGLHPTYIARQLFNFKAGTNKSAQALQMQMVVANMNADDILNIAAYAASLAP
jgi:cytochrome c553